MKKALLLAAGTLAAAALACATTPAKLPPPPDNSVFDSGRTAYGFFPSPPRPTYESVLETFQAMGDHGDVVLIQQNIPWDEFVDGGQGESQAITDIRNQVILARQQGLEAVFVVDPLNGLNRREFFGLPSGWADATFATPEVRQAFRNFTLRVLREIRPVYLGLASEINTYADAHPEDFDNFLSLYRETYAAVKAEAPATQVFASLQWEDLNNLIPGASEGRAPYSINWDQVEAFEPELDVWVISSYPFVVFPSADEIPDDYYAPLLARTDKPLAVGEGGFTSRPIGPFGGTPEDQVGYLEALHGQIGDRLAFWIYLLLSDFDPDEYAQAMRDLGREETDIDTLGMFSAVGLRQSDGTAKPALAVWDGYRGPDG
ncbi:MAG TPA: hypothetical protein VJ160_01605 [Anaerolineales bacterium]|nr:hypothetical protein [Anaerolineales bacterium]